jgi:hypothetical protein
MFDGLDKKPQRTRSAVSMACGTQGRGAPKDRPLPGVLGGLHLAKRGVWCTDLPIWARGKNYVAAKMRAEPGIPVARVNHCCCTFPFYRRGIAALFERDWKR